MLIDFFLIVAYQERGRKKSYSSWNVYYNSSTSRKTKKKRIGWRNT